MYIAVGLLPEGVAPLGIVAFQVHIARRLVVCPLGAVRVTGPPAGAGAGPDRDDGAAPVAALGGRQALVGAVVAEPAAWVVVAGWVAAVATAESDRPPPAMARATPATIRPLRAALR